MADKDGKTEAPTGKRKREARKKGQIPRSPEVTQWATLLAATYLIAPIIRSATTRVVGLTYEISGIIAHPATATDTRVLGQGLYTAVITLLPIAGVMLGIGLVGNIAQTKGIVFSTQRIKPDLGKLNPLKGLKRLVSPTGGWELAKSILKLAILALLSYRALTALATQLMGMGPAGFGASVAAAGSTLLSLLRTVCGIGLVIALADFLHQRHSITKSLKMTKQEVKDESKESEGNPEVKGKIRSIQIRMSRARMMAAVTRASVIVTNPTHYAVALEYTRGSTSAPRVVAKGQDYVALAIRAEGAKHHIPIVEDPPLARALHAACELDEEIPPRLFMAVARLLAFVYTLPGAGYRDPVAHRTAEQLLASP